MPIERQTNEEGYTFHVHIPWCECEFGYDVAHDMSCSECSEKDCSHRQEPIEEDEL